MPHESTALPLSTGSSRSRSARLFIIIVGVHLGFLPWALGTVHLWAQLTSLVLALAGLSVAFFSQAQQRTTLPARRIHLVSFTCGVLVLGWIFLQAANPAWRYQTDGNTWWMSPVLHKAWLPSGMSVPFSIGGPLRALTILSSLFALLLSLHVGVRHRKDLRTLLLVLSANATALAILGLLQKASACQLILWIYTPSNGDFLSTFIYRNHGGAYLNLTLAVTLGLCLSSVKPSGPGARTHLPAPLLALAALIQITAITVSGSRLSAALAFALVAAALLYALFSRLTLRRWQAGPVALALLFVAFGLFCMQAIGSEKLWKRFADAGTASSSSFAMRLLIDRAAAPMVSDRLFFGWGAGCFRFGFPLYSQNYPDLCREGDRPRFVEHAHNDFLEYTIELGFGGLLPVLVLLAVAVASLVKLRVWENPTAALLATGCVITLTHTAFDFVLQNPAVLFTWAFMLFAAVRLPKAAVAVGR